VKKVFLFFFLLVFLCSVSVFVAAQTSSGTPVLTTLSPSSAIAGGPALSVTITGQNFCGRCEVLWNGSRRPTQIVSSTKAVVSLSRTDVAAAGTDHIRMLNPRRETRSNALPFVVSSSSSAPPVSIAVSPSSSSLAMGKSQQFSASVSGTSNTAVTWKSSGGTISSGGMYTAPMSAGSFLVTATSVADTSKSASASVTVATTVAVTISPGSASLSSGGSQQFTASVSGSSNTAVTWSATGGSISSAGLYTAPSAAGTYTVAATSSADTTKSASATVTVSAAPVVAVSIAPGSASLSTGGTQPFTASVTGSSNTAVTWSATSGSISSAGLYTAPSAAGTYTVKATSVADSTKSASATVTVSAPAVVAVTISPVSASMLSSGTQQFKATVTGSSNTAVNWSATGGTVSTAGLYTAPGAAGTFSVTATSAADATKSAAATVTVSVPVVAIALSPGSASLATGATQQFTAAVTGSSNTAVTWSATGGTVSTAGLYTAPSTAGTFTVKAVSAADATKSATASVTVSVPVQHSATLTWSPESTVVGYNVYRGSVSGGPYTMINTSLNAPTNYTDFNVQAGQSYFYVVTSVDSSGTESPFSSQVTAAIP